MYYDALSRNTVKITLTKRDMSNYSLKSESLRARNAETKRTMTRFLKKLQAESALFPGQKAERLFLEAFPSDDGGCVMYVSTLGTEKLPPCEPDDTPVKYGIMCVCTSFADAVSLCRDIAARSEESALYRTDGLYCLIVYTDPDSAAALTRLFGEYGEYSDDETDIAYAAEHGTVICAENAAALLKDLA